MPRFRSAGIVIKGGKILLMHRIKNGKEYYVFPGGGVEPDETNEQAAIREVFEETSIKVGIKKLLYHNVYDDDTEQFFYLCKYLSGEPKLGNSNEAETMKNDPGNIYDPCWYELKLLFQLLLYPLEVRDLLLQDVPSNFTNSPREVKIKVSEIRHTL